MQRFGRGAQATHWLAQSGQALAGQVSPGLAECGLYYANRLSYAETAALLERLSGAAVLSDQQLQQMALEQAVAVSRQWAAQVAASPAPRLRIAPQVDFYAPEALEIVVLCDGICVKQQKARRERKGARAPSQVARRATVRVNTDVWMVERPEGGFVYLVAGIDEAGREVVSVPTQVRQYLFEQYGRQRAPLAVVAITDGAQVIRGQLEEVFGQAVPLILDWYHVEKKLWELMSMVARTKAEKEEHVRVLLQHLWRGRVAEALAYLRTEVEVRNALQHAALVKYLEKHQSEIIDYERRQKAGKSIGSGRMEKGVDQVIGARQKSKGMSWSPQGSKALGILKVLELNQEWESRWFPEAAAVNS